LLSCLLLTGAAGCASGTDGSASPLTLISGGGRPDGLEVSALELQSRVMDFADFFATNASRAYGDLANSVDDPRTRRDMLAMRHTAAWGAYEVAAEANPEVAFLDMVALASLESLVFEDWVLPDVLGDSPEGRAALETFEQMAAEIWRQADGLLTEEEARILRGLITEWRARNPGPQFPSVARFDEFAYARLQSPAATAQGRALFLGSVNEVVKAVNETRVFGERLTFLLTRMPMLLSLRVELAAADLALSPDYRQVLADMHAVSETLAALPDIIEQQRSGLVAEVSAEREAAIDQVADRLAQEREAMLRQIEESQGELRTTLEALTETIDAANGLVDSADGLVARLKPPDGAAGEPSEPIELADVQATLQDATRLLEAAHELIASEAVDARASQLDAAVARLNEATKDSTDYVFRRAVALVIIAVVAVLAGALVLRLIPRRRPA
jgi:hypothetical protein